jgi:hypothetical protein
MDRTPPDLERRLEEWRPNNLTTMFNTDLEVWKEAAKHYCVRPDGGPTFRVMEGYVWGIPKIGSAAHFHSAEEAERVLLAAGFKFIPEEKGFRARA